MQTHDYVQMAFGEEIGISIYSDFEINPSMVALTEFVGKTVNSVREDKVGIEITFLAGSAIKIDLRSKAYHGPEALQLNRRGHPPIIWN